MRAEALQITGAGPISAKELLKKVRQFQEADQAQIQKSAAEAERLAKRQNMDDEDLLLDSDLDDDDRSDVEAARAMKKKHQSIGLTGGSLGESLPAKAAPKRSAKAAKSKAGEKTDAKPLAKDLESTTASSSAPTGVIDLDGKSSRGGGGAPKTSKELDAEMSIVASKHTGASKCLEGFTPLAFLSEAGLRTGLGAKIRGVRLPVEVVLFTVFRVQHVKHR